MSSVSGEGLSPPYTVAEELNTSLLHPNSAMTSSSVSVVSRLLR